MDLQNILNSKEEKMTQDQKSQRENNIFKCIYIKHCIKYKWSKHLKSRSCQTEFKKYDPSICNLQKNPTSHMKTESL